VRTENVLDLESIKELVSSVDLLTTSFSIQVIYKKVNAYLNLTVRNDIHGNARETNSNAVLFEGNKGWRAFMMVKISDTGYVLMMDDVYRKILNSKVRPIKVSY